MFRKIKFALILAAFAGLCACGYSYDWMSGDFEGKTKITRIDGTTKLATISSGEGRINFKVPFYARLGGNTPLPNCNVQFASQLEEYKYSLTDMGREYQGETNDGRGCKAFLTTGARATEIEFFSGEMTRDESGEVVMNLRFREKDATGTSGQYEFEFRGRKAG